MKPSAKPVKKVQLVERTRYYLLYHDVQLLGKTHLRNMKVTELTYNPDGIFKTTDAYQQGAVLPYSYVKAVNESGNKKTSQHYC